MIAWLKLRDNASKQEVEINCTNRKCRYYRKRFVMKFDKNLINKTINCPNCNKPITISKIYFKRKNMK